MKKPDLCGVRLVRVGGLSWVSWNDESGILVILGTRVGVGFLEPFGGSFAAIEVRKPIPDNGNLEGFKATWEMNDANVLVALVGFLC